MNSSRHTLLFLIRGLILCAVLATSCARKEPVYEGKALSIWLEDLDALKSPELRPKAVAAVRGIGTNAIPFLLERLRAKPPPLSSLSPAEQTELRKADPKQIEFALSHLWLGRQLQVRVAFASLGPAAIPAIPELIKLLGDTNSPSLAGMILADMGSKAVLPLAEKLTGGTPSVRIHVVKVLGSMQLNAKSAVPALIAGLKDADSGVRCMIVTTLGHIHEPPETILPALTLALGDSNQEVRLTAAWAIGDFGPLAKAAFPMVMKVYADQYGGKVDRIPSYITDKLKKIDPVAAEASGLK